MSDEFVPPVDETVVDHIPATESEDGDELLDALEAGAQSDPNTGKKMVTIPLGTLVGLKKTAREGKGKIKELEARTAHAAELEQRLEQASPIINAVLNDPNLRASALRAANSTRPSGDSTAQPQDADAVALAEEYGFYLADGITPDAARGQRVLSRIRSTAQSIAEETVRPLAGITLNGKAEANIAAAMAATDDDGVPLATPESIRETAKMLPPHLLANPQVVDLVINNAIGMDRRQRRTPKAPDEPLYLSTQSRRGPAGPILTASDRAFLARNGISEKDYLRSVKNLEQGVSGRRGITLGGE